MEKTSGSGFPRQPPLSLRVPADEHGAWRREAEKAGLSLSAWVRMVCNAKVPAVGKIGGVAVDLESSPELKPLFESGRVQRGSSGVKKRSGVCPHRVPAGSFCKRCEEV